MPNNSTTKPGRRAQAAKSRTKTSQRVAKGRKRPHKSAREDDDDDDEISAQSSEQELDSDALDDDEDKAPRLQRKKTTKATATRKKRRKTEKEDDSDEGEVEGQTIIGKVVQAPKEGRVPPGQVSQNTFNFLSELTNPKHNDRTWFKLHDPVFRLAEKEWQDFIEEFTTNLAEVDPQIPILPPKDVIHRIYNDIRFKNDKTPYKTCLSASLSRSGRKGDFAGYHIMIKPGGNTWFGGGVWQPKKQSLDFIRSNIQRSPDRLRRVITSPVFVAHFGDAEPHPLGKKQNVFGSSDELKVAPKGVDKEHKDIDLLKCRSFVVGYSFTDKQVLSANFIDELKRVAELITPLVHCLNDMMSVIPNETNSNSSDHGQDEEALEESDAPDM